MQKPDQLGVPTTICNSVMWVQSFLHEQGVLIICYLTYPVTQRLIGFSLFKISADK